MGLPFTDKLCSNISKQQVSHLKLIQYCFISDRKWMKKDLKLNKMKIYIILWKFYAQSK